MSDTGFGIKFLLAGSGLLVGGLGTALYFRSKQQKTLEETLSQRTRNYLLNTYKYTAVELLGIGGSAYLGHSLGWSDPLLKFYSDHPWISLAGLIVIPTGSLVATMFISKKKTVAKHVALGVSVASLGIPLCPLVSYVPVGVMNAALLSTGGVIGMLSAIALISPSTTFLRLGGPLLIGGSLLAFAGLAPLIVPGSGAARFASNLNLYGGLVLYSGFLMYDTQKAIARAEAAKSEDELDEINESLSITLDVLNVFMKILEIYLQEEARKRGAKRK